MAAEMVHSAKVNRWPLRLTTLTHTFAQQMTAQLYQQARTVRVTVPGQKPNLRALLAWLLGKVKSQLPMWDAKTRWGWKVNWLSE